jgi:prepilin-type N-terminal cleavage/methylation domain-containing protein
MLVSARCHPRRRPHRARGGMTLVEMTMSLVIMAVILAACTSLVMVTGKAASRGTDGNVGAAATAGRRATSQIVDDLKVATALTERTATAVTMTVPDRDGDGTAETVRYAWSGTPGDPLYRTYNGVTGPVASDVRALNFSFLGKTVGRPPAATAAEQSLFVHATAVDADVKTVALDGGKWAAGTFWPALPPPTGPTTTTAWSATRCRVMLQRDALSTGTATVSLRYADAAGKPTGADLQSGSVAVASVSNSGPSWVEVPFASPAALDPAKGVCLVVSYAAVLGKGGYVGYDAKGADAKNALWTTNDQGASWSTSTGAVLQCRVWGKVTTQDRETLDFQPLPAGP